VKTTGLFALTFLLGAAPAAAQPLRDFCPDRPGLGSPPCTIDRGHGDFELGIADWTLDRHAGERADTIVLGDVLVRYGLDDDLEAQVGWTAIGFLRERDSAGIRHSSGSGDVRLALRRNLRHPDGSGLSIALMPFVTLPVGRAPTGAEAWSAGLVVPLSHPLPHGLQLDFTAEADAAPDSDGSGRHLAYSGIAGLDVPLGKTVTATFELAAGRDEDPAGSQSRLLGGLSLAWMATRSFQVDAGANRGITGGADDVQLYLGIARRF
jgi:hypothetical protein